MATQTLSLREYQREALDYLLARPRAILGDAPGVGKTIVGVCTLASAGVQRGLVIGPLAAMSRWRDEAKRWTTYTVVEALGARGKRIDAIYDARDAVVSTLVLTNYEAARRDWEMLAESRFDALVLDEAHRVKDRRSQNFQSVKTIATAAPRFIAVTGTPVLNSADEIWALLNLIDRKRWSSYWKFVDQFCEQRVEYFGGRPVQLIGDLKAGMEGVLRQELRDVMIRRSLDEILPEIPEVTNVTIKVELSPAERRLYDQMQDFYFAQNDDAQKGPILSLIAPNDAVKVGRLRQLATDWSVFDPDTTDSSKVRALRELFDDLAPEPIVIFSCYEKIVDHVSRVLKIPKISGPVPRQDRDDIQRAFQSGAVRGVVGTIGAMSEAIDLQRSHIVVFMDLDWTPARNDEQAVGRVRRFGQKSDRIVVYTIVARRTIDQYVAKVLANKQNVVDSLVGRSWAEVTAPDDEED